MRKVKAKRIFSLITVGVLCFVFPASAFAEIPIPDFKPDLGTFTPMPEKASSATAPYKVSSPSPTSMPARIGFELPSSAPEPNSLSIYAPEGFRFYYYIPIDEDHSEFSTMDGEFVGRGLSVPAIELPYAYFEGLRWEETSFIDYYTPGSGNQCFLSGSPYVVFPSFPNNFNLFDVGDSSSYESIQLSFVTYCLKYDSKLYVHPCYENGSVIQDVFGPSPLSSSSPSSTPTPELDASDSEGITNIVDFSNVFNSVKFIGVFMRGIYTFFPYLIAIVWLAIVVMIIRLIVG